MSGRPRLSAARTCGYRSNPVRYGSPSSFGPPLASALTAALALSACASTSPADTDRGFQSSPRSPNALEIRLAFDDQADLDLFVTGPDQETVYFGNNPSLSGGRLLRDVRCDSEAPRVEVVRFANPEPGRYRIGIEYARSCRFRREPAAYRIDIDAPELSRSSEGSIAPGRFVPLALELELELDEP